MQGVIDDSGKIYVFGRTNQNLGKIALEMFTTFGNMIILDTIGLEWSSSHLPNTPFKRFSYSATILPNGLIVYIGG